MMKEIKYTRESLQRRTYDEAIKRQKASRMALCGREWKMIGEYTCLTEVYRSGQTAMDLVYQDRKFWH